MLEYKFGPTYILDTGLLIEAYAENRRKDRAIVAAAYKENKQRDKARISQAYRENQSRDQARLENAISGIKSSSRNIEDLERNFRDLMLTASFVPQGKSVLNRNSNLLPEEYGKNWKRFVYKPLVVDCYFYFKRDYNFTAKFLTEIGVSSSSKWVYDFWKDLGFDMNRHKSAIYRQEVIDSYKRSQGIVRSAQKIIEDSYAINISLGLIREIWKSSKLKIKKNKSPDNTDLIVRMYALSQGNSYLARDLLKRDHGLSIPHSRVREVWNRKRLKPLTHGGDRLSHDFQKRFLIKERGNGGFKNSSKNKPSSNQ